MSNFSRLMKERKDKGPKGDWPKRPKIKQCKRCYKKYRVSKDLLGMVESSLCPHNPEFPV